MTDVLYVWFYLQQVTDLQDEMKRKEQRWTSSTTRLRDRIETLETENRELKEEIRLLEKKRLEAWQQKEAEKKSAKAAVTSNPLLKVCVIMFSLCF